MHDVVLICQGARERVVAQDSTVLSLDTEKASAGRILLDAILLGTFVLLISLPRHECQTDLCVF